MSKWGRYSSGMNANQNNMCDGAGPCSKGEVRVLPYAEAGNLIVCKSCFNREMIFRRQRNFELGKDCQYDVPKWADLEIYQNS